MQVKFNCPFCHSRIGAQDDYCGMTVQCPGCEQTITVPSPKLGSGVVLSGYRIEQFLGAGAMGEVYLATQLSMDRGVALKIISENMAADQEERDRFNREIRLLAKLNHQNIVTAFEAGEADGEQFLAMSFVDGVSLDERLDQDGKIPEEEALDICIKVADALKYAWERFEMLHRDVKPANVMIDKYGEVKLMDMGIAKTRSEEAHATMAGMVLGTPYYMSPEQARASNDLDFRSDLYALGAMLFHLVTGEYTHSGANPMEVLTNKISQPAPPARSINPEVSEECEALLAQMLATEEDDRAESWDVAIERLNRVRAGKHPSRKATTGTHKKRKLRMHATAPRFDGDELAEANRAARLARPKKSSAGKVLVMLTLAALAGLGYWHFEPDLFPKKPDNTAPDDTTTTTAATGGNGAADDTVAAVADQEDTEAAKEERRKAEELRRKLEKKAATARHLFEEAENFTADNPYDFTESMRRYQKAVSVGGQLPIGKLAYERVEGLRASRTRLTEHLLVYLAAEALPLLKAGDWDAASALLENYDGILATETYGQRDDWASACNDSDRRDVLMEEIADVSERYRADFDGKAPPFLLAPEQGTETTVAPPIPAGELPLPVVGETPEAKAAARLADFLIRNELADARQEAVELKRQAETDKEETMVKLAGRVLEVAAMPQRVLDGLRKDLGNEVTLQFNSGRESLVLKEVSATEIRGYQEKRSEAGSVGKLGRRFRVADLSTAEVLSRLERSGTTEWNAMRGLLALRLRRFDVADGSFRSVGGELGKALAAALRPLSPELRERDAEQALTTMLRDLGITETRELNEIIRRLDLPNQTEAAVAGIRTAAAAVMTKHADTEVVKTHADLLAGLAKVQKLQWPLAPEKLIYLYDSAKRDDSATPALRGEATIADDGRIRLDTRGGLLVQSGEDREEMISRRGFTFEFFVMPATLEGGIAGQILAVESVEHRYLGLYQNGNDLILECLVDGEMREFPFGNMKDRVAHVAIAYDPDGQIRGALDGKMTLTVDAQLDVSGMREGRIILGASRIAERPWRGYFDSVLVYSAAQVALNFGRHFEAATAWRKAKETQ